MQISREDRAKLILEVFPNLGATSDGQKFVGDLNRILEESSKDGRGISPEKKASSIQSLISFLPKTWTPTDVGSKDLNDILQMKRPDAANLSVDTEKTADLTLEHPIIAKRRIDKMNSTVQREVLNALPGNLGRQVSYIYSLESKKTI